MGSGDHHARSAVQLAHGEGQARRGHQFRVDMHTDAVGHKHLRRHPREQVGLDTAVIADGHGAAFGRKVLHHVVRQPLGGLGHGVNVHPVGARADHAAQSARAKGQIPVEGVLNTVVAAANVLQLLGNISVAGGIFQPAGIPFLHVHASSSVQ